LTARTIPTLPTWLAGMRITGANLALMVSYAQFWANPPEFRMHQSLTQSVSNTTWTQITCDTSDYDSDTGRSGSTPFAYTIPAGMTGRWSFGWVLPWASNGTGARAANLYRNGTATSTYPITPAAGSTATCTGWADRILCNAGDVMSLFGWQSSGGSLGTFIAADSVAVLWGKLDSLATP